MPAIVLTGFAKIKDEGRMTLYGDNTTPFGQLSKDYWAGGVCRHVNKDKKECEIKSTAKTVYKKAGAECNRSELDGVWVTASCVIKKYAFYPIGPGQSEKVQGWHIIAYSVAQTVIGDT